MGDVIFESAALKHLMLRTTMLGDESASSGSSDSASDLLSRGIRPAQGRGRDGHAATDDDNHSKNNKKKRSRVDVESSANRSRHNPEERKLETTNRRNTAPKASRLSHKSVDGKQQGLLNLAHQGTGTHTLSSISGQLPPMHPASNNDVAHDPTTAAALQFLAEGGLAGQLGRRAIAGGTPTAIDVASLQALFASQQGAGTPFQQALSLEQARMAMGGGASQQLMSHSLLANDLQQAAAMRAQDFASVGMRYAALAGQMPTYQGRALGRFEGHGMAPRGAVAPDHHSFLAAAAQAQRNLAFASSGGGGIPSFLDTGNPFANHGALNQLLMRQQVPTSHQLSLHPALGLARRTSVAQPNPSAWLSHQPAVSADLLFARHGPAAGTFPPNHGARLSLESQTYGKRDNEGIPFDLPVILALPEDHLKLSTHQVLLRHQIEAFRATEEDVSTHTRGRNKPVAVNQVGIRCRYCAYVPVGKRQKGSTYFPAALLGLYQAAQNMSTTHMQCGLCSEMPNEIKHQFAHLISTKVASSGAGRPYWARAAKKLGLVDSEDGIRFIRDLPSDEARLVDRGDAKET